jgi:hypothetical protein
MFMVVAAGDHATNILQAKLRSLCLTPAILTQFTAPLLPFPAEGVHLAVDPH